MVMTPTFSRIFNWEPNVIQGDDPRKFLPDYYIVKEESAQSVKFFISKFADLPTFGMWADRSETDNELLEELGSGWRGFATEE